MKSKDFRRSRIVEMNSQAISRYFRHVPAFEKMSIDKEDPIHPSVLALNASNPNFFIKMFAISSDERESNFILKHREATVGNTLDRSELIRKKVKDDSSKVFNNLFAASGEAFSTKSMTATFVFETSGALSLKKMRASISSTNTLPFRPICNKSGCPC
jgi:hypothetical protein